MKVLPLPYKRLDLRVAVTSPGREVKMVSPISTFVLNTLTLRQYRYNLGQNKMEQQTPIPPKSRMKPREGQKRAIFLSLIWGEGGSRFSIYFVQDCSISYNLTDVIRGK